MKEYKTDAGYRVLTEAELIEEAYKQIRRVLKRKYAKHAREHDDLEQDVILAVYNAVLRRYDSEKGTLEAFIYGTAEKQLAKAVRPIERRPQTISLTDELANTITAEDALNYVDDETDILIWEFSETLTKREQKALRLKADGLSNTQIYNALHPRAKKRRIGQAMTAVWKTIKKKYDKWRTNKCK